MKIMRAWDYGHNKVRFVYADPETNRTKLGEERFDWYFFIKNQDYETHAALFSALKDCTSL